MNISIKTVIKTIFLVALVGLAVWGITALNQIASQTAVVVDKWVADAHTEAESQWEVVAENASLRLSFNPGETQLMVEDLVHGTVFLSNPENAAKDTVAFGQNKTLIQSLVDITYVDNQSASYTVNNYAGSTKEDTYRYEYADNGVYVTFQFEKMEFELPLYFGITEDRFVAKVLGDQIVQHGSLRISNVSLLPFFGAAAREETGYMVVPDGSGAIIRFQNQKQGYLGYTQPVYGRNLTQNVQTYSTVGMNVMMPVFGICKESGSMLAVITNGAAMAELRANVAGKITSTNNVYSAVSFIQSENNTLLSGSDNEEVSTMLSKQTNNFDYEVSYFLLDSGAEYPAMAARYRQYLIEEQGMADTDSVPQKQISLDFIGGMMTRKTFLGVPYMAVEPLTSFADAKAIALELQQLTGASLQVILEDILSGGSMSKMPTTVSYASSLGGKSGFQKMAAALNDAGIPYYAMFDPATLKENGRGYSSLDAARNVSRSASRQYVYRLSSGTRDTSKEAVYLLTPSAAAEVLGKLAASVEKNGLPAMALTGITNKMYGDYRKDTVPQFETESFWVSALAQAASSVDKLLLDGTFAYGFPYASAISNVPVYSSRFDVEDDTIPFYQLVVSGSAELYSAPLNDCGNLREAILRNVEYGVSPTFRLMSAAASSLQDTPYQFYYSLAYADWQDEILSLSAELADLPLGQRLVDHKAVGENVYASTFADGSVVYVNYNSQDVEVEGVNVPAMNFVREEAR